MVKPWQEPGYDPKADELNSFHFVPTKSYGFAFTALFAAITIVHLAQALVSRRWWLISVVCGGILEILGWSCRLWGAFNPRADNAFLIQTTVLIIGPSFFSAAVYAMLGWIIAYLGPQYSLLKPRLYWIVFIGCDFISLVLQSAGGYIASSADDNAGSDRGTHIMLGGIIFQLVATIVFSVLAAHFLWKARRDGALLEEDRIRYLILGVTIATASIVLRGVYRVPELAQGWHGYLITHEPYFLFDSVPMVICVLALAVFHPVWTLPRDPLGVPKMMPVSSSSSTASVERPMLGTLPGTEQHSMATIGTGEMKTAPVY